MTYEIMGRCVRCDSEEEEIDSADSEQEAKYLLNEYRMAFGAGWLLWVNETSVDLTKYCARRKCR